MQRIQKNVAMPQSNRLGRPKKYPWETMAVGDSFVLPAPDLNNARSHTRQAGLRYKKKFVVMHHNGRFRVWRTE